jgi:predicted PurR-regulated permease PerM
MWGVIALICSLIFVVFVINKIGGLIKSWINRKKPAYDQEKFDRLAKAFNQYKKRSQRRIENLETTIEKIESGSSHTTEQSLDDKSPQETIDIEVKTRKNQKETPGGEMKNMLRE